MAVDGHVDIAAKLESDRLDGRFHDGEDVAEAHAEFEFACSEIFGIEMGTRIINAIFGEFSRNTVDPPDGDNVGINRDGSWTFLRFSTEGSTGSAAAAAGWEISDGARTVRLIQVGGDICLYQKVGNDWDLVINFEDTREIALTELEDVEIKASDLKTETVGLAVGITGNEDLQKWDLTRDTTVNGVDTWGKLQGVKQQPYTGLAPPDTVWQSNGVDLVSPVNIAGQKKVGSAFRSGPITVPIRTTTYINTWARYNVPTGYDGISTDKQYFTLSVPGIYKCNLGWKMTAGSTAARSPSGDPEESYCALAINIGSGIKLWPPRTPYDEVWWEFQNQGSAGGWATRLATVDSENDSGEFGNALFYLTSAGNSVCKFRIHLKHTLDGGDRSMKLDFDIERVS